MASDGKHLAEFKFKPGESGNPQGRRPVTPEALGLPKFDKDSFGRLCWDALLATDDEAKKVIHDPEESQIRKYLASIIIKGRLSGDYRALDWLAVRSGLSPLPNGKGNDVTEGAAINIAENESRQELVIRILERSRLIDDPRVREVLRRKLIDVTPPSSQD